MLLVLVARLIAPATSTITAGDVESSAVEAAQWFVDLELLSREAGGALEADLRTCATDNRCIATRLEHHRIDRALYVVVNEEAGFATAEVLGKVSRPLATEAVEIEGSVEKAVSVAVTNALAAAGHRRGARLVVEVAPEDAVVRAASSILSPGEPIILPAGTLAIEASASGFVDLRREILLAPGQQMVLRLELEEASSVLTSWWLWTTIAVVVAAAIAIPVVALRSSGDPPAVCYGDQTLCERGP